MRVVRDRADARWLPSRFRFALFRLAALVVMSRSKPREQPGLVLVIDRDQTAFEHYLLSVGALIAGTCFMAAALLPSLGPGLALVLSLPLTLAVFSGVVVAAGLLIEPIVTKAGAQLLLARQLNGLTHMSILLGAAVFFALRPSWVRPVALAFLVAVAVNIIAAIVLVPFRRRLDALDRQFGVGT